MRASTKKGQAMIEFAAGLLVLLLIVIGFIHISKLAMSSLDIHGEIRAEAGMTAMQNALAVSPEAISDWEKILDKNIHGSDFKIGDKAKKNQPKSAAIIDFLVSHSVREENDWQEVEKTAVSALPLSMVSLARSRNLGVLMGCVYQAQTDRIEVDPFIRTFVYNKEAVAVKEEIWMPLMGDLYSGD